MKSVAPSRSPVEDDVVVSENGSPPAEPSPGIRDIPQRSYVGANLFSLLLAIIALAMVGQVFLISTPPNLPAGVALLTIAGAVFVVLRSWMRDPEPDGNLSSLPRFAGFLDRLPPFYLLFALALVSSGIAFWCAATPTLRPGPALIAWMTGIGLFLAGTRYIAVPRTDLPAEASWTRREILALAVLTLAALVLRVTMLETIPQNFGGDEGEMGMEARGVLEGSITNPFSTGWLSHPTLWFFLQALSLTIFGNNVFGLRILSALIGTLTIPLLYLLARPLFGRNVAFGAATLLAMYHLHIHFSRLGVNNIADPFLALAAFTAFFSGVRRLSPFAFGLTGVVCGIAQHFYMGSRLTPLLIAALIVHLALCDRQRFRTVVLSLPLIIVGFGLGFGPLIAHFIANPSALTARLAMVGVVQSGWLDQKLAEGFSLSTIFIDQARQSFGAYTFIPDRAAWYDPGIALLDPVSSVLLTLGVVLALVNWRRSAWFLPIAWLIGTAILGGMLLVNTPESPRYVTTTPALCLLIMLAIQQIAAMTRWAFHLTHTRQTFVSVAIIALLAGWSINFYFRDYTPRRAYGWTNTEVATRVAHFINDQSTPVYVYLFAPPRIYLGNGSIRFIARDLQGRDILEPVTDPEQIMPPPEGRRPLFIFLPEREAELAVVAQRFPGGVTLRFQGEREPGTLFLAYTPP
ncbi:MAG: glycosyltransferase family 39 protein [Roseiflexus sp.]